MRTPKKRWQISSCAMKVKNAKRTKNALEGKRIIVHNAREVELGTTKFVRLPTFSETFQTYKNCSPTGSDRETKATWVERVYQRTSWKKKVKVNTKPTMKMWTILSSMTRKEEKDHPAKRRCVKFASSRSERAGVTPTKSWAEFAFEPSVIKAQMLTATDDEIRNADWPERLSIENVQVPNLNTPRDFAEEATWIYDRVMGVGSIRGIPTEAGELLLRGKMDYESDEVMEMRLYQLQNEWGGQLPDTREAERVDMHRMVFEDGSYARL